jgi:hypothetical protein
MGSSVHKRGKPFPFRKSRPSAIPAAQYTSNHELVNKFGSWEGFVRVWRHVSFEGTY